MDLCHTLNLIARIDSVRSISESLIRVTLYEDITETVRTIKELTQFLKEYAVYEGIDHSKSISTYGFTQDILEMEYSFLQQIDARFGTSYYGMTTGARPLGEFLHPPTRIGSGRGV